MFGQRIFAQGHGYGMGVAVVMEPAQAEPLRCGGEKAPLAGRVPTAVGGKPTRMTAQ